MSGFPTVILTCSRRAQANVARPDALVLNYAARTVSSFAVEVRLVQQEFMVIAALCAVPGRRVSTCELVEFMYGDRPDGGPDDAPNVIRHRIHSLRSKLPRVGLAIDTIPQFGYAIEVVAAARLAA